MYKSPRAVDPQYEIEFNYLLATSLLEGFKYSWASVSCSVEWEHITRYFLVSTDLAILSVWVFHCFYWILLQLRWSGTLSRILIPSSQAMLRGRDDNIIKYNENFEPRNDFMFKILEDYCYYV